MNGVNLGNWLVVERWMDESLFADIEGSDEYSLSSDDRGRKRLLRHRETYITEADFKWMSEQGVEIVRLPIGYWLFGDEKPYVASVDKVDWTMDMADKYSLKVLIDLHGAPGSQNGYEHSGRAGTASWYDRPAYRRETETILLRIAHRYGSRESLWGIELLNEPVADTARQYFILLNFYRCVY